MSITNWLWTKLIRYLARSRGFLDPIRLLSRLDRLSQPSEVRAPLELLRAGAVFHARGLINARVIQNNLDWIWPYWVKRQFDPADESFLPRGFTASHVNLTHRNWTAIGMPDSDTMPIVDPRGLLTPFFDGWSIDTAFVGDNGTSVFPSQSEQVQQTLSLADGFLGIRTVIERKEVEMHTYAHVERAAETDVCYLQARATGEDGWLVVSLRPFNPEGISFVNTVELLADREGWEIDGKTRLRFNRCPEQHAVSNYKSGDVLICLVDSEKGTEVKCKAGLATAAAMFRVERGSNEVVEVCVDLSQDKECDGVVSGVETAGWSDALEGLCQIDIPNNRWKELFENALRSVILHSPKEVYPGPYTYKRFWFRDAAYILNGLMSVGAVDRAERALDQFSDRQRIGGYFHSQDGEWDSNGEALWVMNRFCELTGSQPKQEWKDAVIRGAKWIDRKRCSQEIDEDHAGLLPAGFSAEHFGNNDYYYWDDFWSIAGLRGAARMCEKWAEQEKADHFREIAESLETAIERSLSRTSDRRTHQGVPASPYRRMDGAAVGIMVASYPLQIWSAEDDRILDTIEYLREECFLDGAFFHHVMHSGVNAYLTLHIAQALLRAGDMQFYSMAERIGELASPTGQWPEAIHPHTDGGCMGDGQHIWAASEWIMMLRNMFVREEGKQIILASGVPEEWLQSGETLRLGPTFTRQGPISVEIDAGDEAAEIRLDGQWRDESFPIEVRLPAASKTVKAEGPTQTITVPLKTEGRE
ncbi:MAG: hypothetical protein ACLFWL_13030 [Candidatus Brocadiia bacterium]